MCKIFSLFCYKNCAEKSRTEITLAETDRAQNYLALRVGHLHKFLKLRYLK